MKILVMGLAGSGKTTLSKKLSDMLGADYFNADEVRKKYNDWDFSLEGRYRQASRLSELCEKSNKKFSVADFICPTKETRKIFSADYIVLMNTIQKCESVNGPAANGSTFEDTNQLFVPPKLVHFNISTKNIDYWIPLLYNDIITYFPRF